MADYYALIESGRIEATADNYVSVRSAGTGTVTDGAGLIVGQSKEGVTFHMWRGGLFFDTSAIPDDDIILTATLYLRGSYGGLNSAISDREIQHLVIVSGDDINGSGLVTADYGELIVRSTSFGSITGTDWITLYQGQYSPIPLNANGIAAINKGGKTIFGLRGLHDINSVPDGPGFIERNRFDFVGYNVDDSVRAKLVIAHSVAGGGGDIAIVETRLHWKKANGTGEVYIQGILIGASDQARGNIAIVEERIQYVGADGNEYYWLGIEIGASAQVPGNIASVEGRIHYVDTSGKERYIKGIPV